MKRIIPHIIPFFLLSLILAAYFAYSSPAISYSYPVNKNNFKWGIGFDPYPNGAHQPEVFEETLKNAKKLGVKWLRMEIPHFTDDPFGFIDPLIKKAKKEGLRVVIAFQPKNGFLDFSDPYQAGYDQAYEIAKHYPQIQYFQIANEPAAEATKIGWPGIDQESYDQEKYQKVLLWLRGASDGVKKANPRAKRIITGHWLHIGFFAMLNQDGLDYEIIGWDWHQKSSDLTQVENQGKTYNLIELLSKFNKELWITEAGLIDGSLKGENPQAVYLEKLIKQVYNSGKFSGFFTFTLYDGLPKNEDDNHLGLIKMKKDKSGGWQLGDPKEAFLVYQEVIRQLNDKN